MIKLTTIGSATNAGLALLKKLNEATALPGDNLVYVVTCSNNSSGSLKHSVISATPTHKTSVSASPGTLGAGFLGCSVTTQLAVSATGSVRCTLTGALGSVGIRTVTYTVQILP